MKKFLAMAVAVSALAVAAPASAQGWQSINERQARLDQRIDVGVRNGSLTRGEAARLRDEFRDLARLEARYRSSYGLSLSERRDLDQRFDALSARIRYERRDDDDRGDGGWGQINQRQREVENRLEYGIRTGRISRYEAVRIRAELNDFHRAEERYRRNGLNYQERRDLTRMLDRLDRIVQAEMNDRNSRFG
jgi:hypothetical protein